MVNMKIIWAALCITAALVIMSIIAGCIGFGGQTQATPNQIPPPADTTIPTQIHTADTIPTKAYTAAATIPPSQTYIGKITTAPPSDFSKVTHVEVDARKSHSGPGAENDGITIYPSLRDSQDSTIMWSDPTLPVDIEIITVKWVSETGSNGVLLPPTETRDQIVYKGSGTISRAYQGIQIPFAEMKVPAGQRSFGWTYITVHTPDGKTYSAINKYTPLTP